MTKLTRTFLCATALFFGLCSLGLAQGFGHFSVGPAIGNFDKLQRDLQQYQFLGYDFALAKTGVSVGGGGFAIINSEILLGGNGFGSMFGSSLNNRGEASLSTGAGFFNLGYALHNKDGWLLYPYGGVGYSGTILELTNSSPTPFALSASHSLQPGETKEYSAGGIALEGGFGLKKLIAREGHKSGFIFGIDFGTYGMPALQDWEHDGQEITGITSTRGQAYYVKFSFGGGFF